MRDQYSDAPTCYYCGDPASDVEHVIPKAFIQHLRDLGDMELWNEIGWYSNRLKLVKSCRECNVLLGSKYFGTALERKAFVKKALRRRYKKLLTMPIWTDRELGQLDGQLQNFVIEGVIRKERLMRRLRF